MTNASLAALGLGAVSAGGAGIAGGTAVITAVGAAAGAGFGGGFTPRGGSDGDGEKAAA